MRCENEAQRITKTGASARWALAGKPSKVGRRAVVMLGIVHSEQEVLYRWFHSQQLRISKFCSVR